MTGLSYDDLVAAATVGLGHSQLQVTGLSGPAAGHTAVLDKDDPAAALLDAAALMTVACRAGLSAVRPGDSEAAPADSAPELPGRAVALLTRALGSDRPLLADLLELLASHGYRAPAPLLPALLDAAVRDRTLRAPVAGVLGARGRWLARHRSGWRQVADLGMPGATPQTNADDPQAWLTGHREQRQGYLAGLRDRDPAAARGLLAAGWASETGEDRAGLLPILAQGLSDSDEDFLEQALDDRAESVRVAARRLLAKLPDSAFSRRAASRAAPLLTLKQRGKRRWLVANPPGAADEAAVRDGIRALPPRHSLAGSWTPTQVAAWLLTQLIAAAPVTVWTTQFGLEARQIVALPFPEGLGAQVHSGWRIAAVSQGGGDWAQALLWAGRPRLASDWPPVPGPDDRELAALLPPGAWMARIAVMLSDPSSAAGGIAEIAGLPKPWSGVLADAVIALLRSSIAAAGRPPVAPMFQWPEQLASAAGRGLPVTGRTDYAAALAQLASAASCPSSWAGALRRAADTIALRRAFTEEIR
jgi:hypothetical protein